MNNPDVRHQLSARPNHYVASRPDPKVSNLGCWVTASSISDASLLTRKSSSLRVRLVQL